MNIALRHLIFLLVVSKRPFLTFQDIIDTNFGLETYLKKLRDIHPKCDIFKLPRNSFIFPIKYFLPK